MIKDNSNTPRSKIGSKCETKKKSNWYNFFFSFEVYEFLTTHMVTLLELEQAPKDFLDFEIYKVLIKLLDQTKRKTKKHRREKER